MIKRRVEGLHQVTEIGSQDITDTWEPTLPGLNKLEIVRHVSVLTITLSTAAQNSGSPGYQLPLAKELVQPLVLGEDGDDPLALELEARGERSGWVSWFRHGSKPIGPCRTLTHAGLSPCNMAFWAACIGYSWNCAMHGDGRTFLYRHSDAKIINMKSSLSPVA